MVKSPVAVATGPAKDCRLCPRLADFRDENRRQFPDWFNGAVPSFGTLDAKILIVGLAPGLRGANRTGRPFTGDYAGELLYPSLLKFGLARGTYRAEPGDIELVDCRITNAVRCVPPANKPTPAEQKTCRGFLATDIAAMPKLRSILALGRIAHDAVLSTLGLRKVTYPFGHATTHSLNEKLSFTDSYHCSRYNLNTGVLTEPMFHQALELALKAAYRKS